MRFLHRQGCLLVSKQRAKGTGYEVEIREELKPLFPDIERAPFSSPLGDFVNFPIILEAKNQKSMTLSTWVDQAEKSGIKAGLPYAVVHKRARKNVSKSYVTLPLDQLIPAARAIVAELDRIEQDN